ncbi:MAG: RNA polymerase sigma factor [bacterium]|nr:RNA polymerase sigma factor [bacterium]
MKNNKKYDQLSDDELIDMSLTGNTNALEEIINRYKDLVFNFSLRMVGDYDTAQDVSQEVLIKVITKLSTFQKKSSLKTWILRITSNHVISQKRKIKEFIFSDFSDHNELLEGLSDRLHAKEIDPELSVISDEMKNQCIEGMLLCLNRDQRSAFIIGAVMGIGSAEGAQVLNISKEAFRKRLSRARKDLSQYMNNHCGLINEKNSCRCARKAKAAFEAGYISDNRTVFNKKRLDNVSRFIQSSRNIADTLLDKVSEVYRQVPVLELDSSKIKKLIQSTEFEDLIGFS